MKTSVRDLTAKLSEHLRTAAAGEDVVVSAHGRPVAKIIAASKSRDLQQLKTAPGIAWNGDKPGGLTRAAPLKRDQQMSNTVSEDRSCLARRAE